MAQGAMIRSGEERRKAPNSKLQAPEKLQTPKLQGGGAMFDIWSLVLLWSLLL
jgi:hypothetical protein